MSWIAADKATYVLYGIASIALLKVTNAPELGLFTLFNNLHNFILNVAAFLGLNALLQFSANKEHIPLINFYALLNFAVVFGVLTGLAVFCQHLLADVFDEPQLAGVIAALPLLVVLSVPRHFMLQVLYREVAMARVFLMNLAYCGSLSGLIFYHVWRGNFLTYSDIIDINYIGTAAAVVAGLLLCRRFIRFRLPARGHDMVLLRYVDIVRFSLKFAAAGVVLMVPKQLDVYFVQYFFGIGVVGLYSPAKTIFRFVEDLINAVYLTIYAPVVRCFAAGDAAGVGSIISKTMSVLVFGFVFLTLCCWLFGGYIFPLFLPVRFAAALPVFEVLMLASILMPITLLHVVVSASGRPLVVAKYGVFGLLGWLLAFILVGFLQSGSAAVALPYLVFVFVFGGLLWRFGQQNYGLRWCDLWRVVPDGWRQIQSRKRRFSR